MSIRELLDAIKEENPILLQIGASQFPTIGFYLLLKLDHAHHVSLPCHAKLPGPCMRGLRFYQIGLTA